MGSKVYSTLCQWCKTKSWLNMVFRGKFRILEMTILSYSAAAVTLLFSLILISTIINCDSGIGGSGSGGTGSYTPYNQRKVVDEGGSSVTATDYGRVKGVVYSITDTTAVSGVFVSIGNIISRTTGTDGKYDLYKVPITTDFGTENKTVKAEGGVIYKYYAQTISVKRQPVWSDGTISDDDYQTHNIYLTPEI